MTKEHTKAVRLRFAPSPTGALHIGGLRTALFNYLFAKAQGGSFILRVEDTDQKRYVEGAEDYLMRSLAWLGLIPDESPSAGGQYGPYRQSERKPMYRRYAEKLIEAGHAYYAFDTAEELAELRSKAEAEGKSFQYSATTRAVLNNSLNMSEQELQERLEQGQPHVIRICIPEDETVSFQDIIRGTVRFQSKELDDKVLLKEDGMPTYHLANVVDDYLMRISHIVRGEEWLSSTPLHVYLYRFLGWEAEMPIYAHLPLILRPDGKGKLSKRDGAKFGFPVFPLDWKEQEIEGFDGWGFLPEAVLNFLAFLGWTAPDDKEICSMEELIASFSLKQVHKSGARFDFDKAKWFNQQYLISGSNESLAAKLQPLLKKKSSLLAKDSSYLSQVVGLMKERVYFLSEIAEQGTYFFQSPDLQEIQEQQGKDLEKKVLKKWDAERTNLVKQLCAAFVLLAPWEARSIKAETERLLQDLGFKAGELFPFLRFALSGSLKGPDIFEMLEVLGKEESDMRMRRFAAWLDTQKAQV